jgi:hypothetical protein
VPKIDQDRSSAAKLLTELTARERTQDCRERSPENNMDEMLDK